MLRSERIPRNRPHAGRAHHVRGAYAIRIRDASLTKLYAIDIYPRTDGRWRPVRICRSIRLRRGFLQLQPTLVYHQTVALLFLGIAMDEELEAVRQERLAHLRPLIVRRFTLQALRRDVESRDVPSSRPVVLRSLRPKAAERILNQFRQGNAPDVDPALVCREHKRARGAPRFLSATGFTEATLRIAVLPTVVGDCVRTVGGTHHADQDSRRHRGYSPMGARRSVLPL